MKITTLLLVLVAAVPSLAASEVTLLDFHAEWCGPCRQMGPTIDRLAEGGMAVKKIDIDKSPGLAQRYKVQAVPTFIVVDAAGKELGRTQGAQPASEITRLYREAKAKAVQEPRETRKGPSQLVSDDEEDAQAEDRPVDGEENDDAEDASPGRFENPKPWQTVVRIKVHGQGSIGFGSGTIISSTPEESLILTCAHVFKLEGTRQHPPASKFPRKITIDLFDGNLRGQKPASVAYAESFEGRAVDYDFTLDVGLIRIRPGRRLPSARVVPAHWTPTERMRMLTVGCSEGRDASVWATKILNPRMKGLSGNATYEAIECATAPLQGRSGGGLFTDDGYVAGVCNFAEPRGNVGLYATPRSIYSILDRNRLMTLYSPVNAGGKTRLVADNGPKSRVRPGSQRRNAADEEPSIARGQSPESDEDARSNQESDSGLVMIPSPEMLKIKVPGAGKKRVSRSAPVAAATASTDRSGVRWQLKSQGAAVIEKPQATEMNVDRSVAFDAFSSFEDDEPSEEASEGRSESRKPVGSGKSKASGSSTKDYGDLIWRSVKSSKP